MGRHAGADATGPKDPAKIRTRFPPKPNGYLHIATRIRSASTSASRKIGRTNLRPYYNLDFDPNDAYTVQAGYQDEEAGRFASIRFVRDNRGHPDQRHLHFTWRQGTPDRHRFSIDVL